MGPLKYARRSLVVVAKSKQDARPQFGQVSRKDCLLHRTRTKCQDVHIVNFGFPRRFAVSPERKRLAHLQATHRGPARVSGSYGSRGFAPNSSPSGRGRISVFCNAVIHHFPRSLTITNRAIVPSSPSRSLPSRSVLCPRTWTAFPPCRIELPESGMEKSRRWSTGRPGRNIMNVD